MFLCDKGMSIPQIKFVFFWPLNNRFGPFLAFFSTLQLIPGDTPPLIPFYLTTTSIIEKFSIGPLKYDWLLHRP